MEKTNKKQEAKVTYEISKEGLPILIGDLEILIENSKKEATHIFNSWHNYEGKNYPKKCFNHGIYHGLLASLSIVAEDLLDKAKIALVHNIDMEIVNSALTNYFNKANLALNKIPSAEQFYPWRNNAHDVRKDTRKYVTINVVNNGSLLGVDIPNGVNEYREPTENSALAAAIEKVKSGPKKH